MWWARSPIVDPELSERFPGVAITAPSMDVTRSTSQRTFLHEARELSSCHINTLCELRDLAEVRGHNTYRRPRSQGVQVYTFLYGSAISPESHGTSSASAAVRTSADVVYVFHDQLKR